MKKKEIDNFVFDPPLAKTQFKYVVFRIRDGMDKGEFFITSGGEYRYDLYELIFQSDNEDEVKDLYMKLRYDPKKPL